MQKMLSGILFLGVMIMTICGSAVADSSNRGRMNQYDMARDQELRERAADWRNGAVVYQIIVDRFVPSVALKAKKKIYASPRILRDWRETPRKGHYVNDAGVWSHELEFWGGDFDSLKTRLDYLQNLGVDVVYLNPIFESLTNHKYDAWDYHKIDPCFGTRKDLAGLADELHRRNMKLVLDGVFNHMGSKSPMFLDAKRNPKSKWRDFFKFTDRNRRGYIGWVDVENLPELNIENPKVRDYLFARPDSVVQSYLRQEGIDGWRLDVAFDLGFQTLTELTACAHTAKPGSLVVGEIWNYPEEWRPAVDSVMNMHGRAILLKMLDEKVKPAMAAAMWETMIVDAGMDHILKTWLVLDNHDTSRLATIFPEFWKQRMARILQFTLPGSPCLYYGSEIGMTGGEDPEQRAPMRWDLVTDENAHLDLHRKLIAMRKAEPALRYGDFRKLNSEKLFAFLRRTSSASETVIILANPSNKAVREIIQIRDGKIQGATIMKDRFSDFTVTVSAGMVEVTVPPHEIMLLKPDTADYPEGYNRYDMIY